ncbi:MAG: T9SS type A sorting domain-containing protein [Bacteroidetes bacterium]|nr:T9SS type A sorting domain-containing protein [Bacteroidota bacterium]
MAVVFIRSKPKIKSVSFTIKYVLPQSVNAAYLTVYDLSGKQLATFPMEKGNTSLTISGNDLAAGIYLYSIIADGNVMGTKRMVIAGK